MRKYCVNYFHRGYPINCRDFDVVITNILINENTVNSSTGVDYDTQCVLSDINVISKLAEQRLQLKIFSLPIASGGTIIKSESPRKRGVNHEKNAQYVNFLLESYHEWFKYGIAAVHCEHGSQRTALLALVFFLLDQFDKIFIVNNPHQTVQNIIQLCRAVISQRELFKPNLAQFYAAIELTVKLKTAMENLLIQNVSTNNDILSPPAQDKNETEQLASRIKFDKISQPLLKDEVKNEPIDTRESSSTLDSVTEKLDSFPFWNQKTVQTTAPGREPVQQVKSKTPREEPVQQDKSTTNTCCDAASTIKYA